MDWLTMLRLLESCVSMDALRRLSLTQALKLSSFPILGSQGMCSTGEPASQAAPSRGMA